MKKKLFSILLSLAMVVTMMPMATFVSLAGTSSEVGKPLCFRAEEAGSTIQLSGPAAIENAPGEVVELEYSTDGEHWEAFEIDAQYTLNSVGDKFYLRNVNIDGDFFSEKYWDYVFKMTGKIAASGDVTTLISTRGTKTLTPYCFKALFKECTSLSSAPELPAMELAENCYYHMFYKCKGLKEAPKLPAKILEKGCYMGMFMNCINLIKAPDLLSTEIAESCYKSMFSGCSELKEAPALPATELEEGCYGSMFLNCLGLEKAPALPATVLPETCYSTMFRGCTSLKKAPALPATVLQKNCYTDMFNGCAELQSIAVNFDSAWSNSYSKNWVSGVSATGTFTCPSTLPIETGAGKIPAGWNINNTIIPVEKINASFLELDLEATGDALVEVTDSSGNPSTFGECITYSMSPQDSKKIAVLSNSQGAITVKGLKRGVATLHIWNTLNPEASINCLIKVNAHHIWPIYEELEKDPDPIVTPVVAKTTIKSLKAGKKSFTVKVSKLAKENSDGYQVRYSLKKNMKKSIVKKISNKYNTVSKKVKGLKSRKRYYVQVRTIKKTDGEIAYSKWSKKKSIKTK